MGRFALGVAAALLTASAQAQDASVVAPRAVAFGDDGAVAVSLTGAPGDPARGRELMDKGSGNCIACHAVTELESLGFHGEIGPPLDGVADRWDEAGLRGILSDAKRTFPGTMMPSFYKVAGYVRPGDGFTGKAAAGDLPPLLTAQEVEDVVAYLMTLKES